MGRYIVKRILGMIPMFFFISFIIYLALELCPGDPINALLPPEMVGSVAVDIEALREQYGLNDPFLVRYFRWVFNMFKGDFGYSIASGTAVSAILANALPSTVSLCLAALIISTVFGLLLGLFAGVYKDTMIDYTASTFGVVSRSFPDFFIGICAIQIFAVTLGLLPSGGRTDYGVQVFGKTCSSIFCLLVRLDLF